MPLLAGVGLKIRILSYFPFFLLMFQGFVYWIIRRPSSRIRFTSLAFVTHLFLTQNTHKLELSQNCGTKSCGLLFFPSFYVHITITNKTIYVWTLKYVALVSLQGLFFL
ncbi:hypothetical protein ACB092_02G245300 [Castanea dentata]